MEQKKNFTRPELQVETEHRKNFAWTWIGLRHIEQTANVSAIRKAYPEAPGPTRQSLWICLELFNFSVNLIKDSALLLGEQVEDGFWVVEEERRKEAQEGFLDQPGLDAKGGMGLTGDLMDKRDG